MSLLLAWPFGKRPVRGFTLIELMIVVAIIGLLAALAIPNFLQFQARAKQSEPKANLKALYIAQLAYYNDQEAYCDSLGLIGFLPERNNRYLYTQAIGSSSTSGLNRTTSQESNEHANAIVDCGLVPASTMSYNTVGDDVYKWGAAPVPYAGTPAASVTLEPNCPTCVAPSVSPGVMSGGGTPGCSSGQCEFTAMAEGNIDSDQTNDVWYVYSVSGLDANAIGGSGKFAAGEPENNVNDVTN